MKHLLLTSALLVAALAVFSQNVGIGTDTPHPSAKLEIASDSSGVLVPRMTAAERDDIVDPADGLLVFVTDDSTFYYFEGTAWVTLDSRTRRLLDADGDTRVEVEQTADDDIIRFMSRDSQVMIIDSNGNVGIGDTMPEASLTIKGGNFLQTPINPTVAGSVAIGTAPQFVYVSGRYAYILDQGTDDLKVVDVSDPSSPVVAGSVAIGTNPRFVYVTGRYAYVVNEGTDDLSVVDVSNPASPSVVGSVALGTAPVSVYVSGRYAYVVDVQTDDLKVIDVSDPASPVVVGSVTLGNAPHSVYVSGRYAYVVDLISHDLKVIDVSDPSSPVVAGSVAIGTAPQSVYVSGRYAYVVDSETDDLKVIDVSNPASPTVAGSVVIGESPVSVYVAGRYAYVVNFISGDLNVVDVSDPASPVVVGSVVLGPNPRSVYVAGRYAYMVVGGSNDLKVIDVSGGEITSLMAHSLEAGNLQVRNDITAQGQLQVSGGITAGSGGIYSDGDVGVSGDLSLRGGNLLQTPVNPTVVGSVAIGTFPQSVYVSGRYAYVVDQDTDDLKVVDVSAPSSPTVVGSVALGLRPWSVYVSGRYAYVVDIDTDDLKVVDVSAPSSPIVVGSVVLGTLPQSVYVSGRYAYVVDVGSDDLKVVDVSAPSSPTVVGSVAIGIHPAFVYVSGRYAYVVDINTDDLKVVDVSDPSSPTVVGSVAVGTDPISVYVSGHYAYVVVPGSDDLKVVDVSAPSSPTVVGSVALGTGPVSVYVSGRYAFVVDQLSDDLKVVDVSAPSSPTVVGSVAIGTIPESVYVSGRYAYVVDSGTDDLKVIDVSGGEMTSLKVHSLEAGNLQVQNDVIAQGQLQVTGGISAGSGGIYSDGDIGTSGDLKINGILDVGADIHGDLIPATNAMYDLGSSGQRWDNLFLQEQLELGPFNTYDKIRLWSGSDYTIGMTNVYALGFVTDYATTFTMPDNSARGWLWRDINDTSGDGAMSLTTDGRLYVKNMAAFNGNVDVQGQLQVSGSVNVNAGDMEMNENSILFSDPENGNSIIEFTASDSSFPNEGISLRAQVNPPSGEPIFRVMSSGGSERLRVEHAGLLSTSNSLGVDGTGASYLMGDVGIGTTAPSAQLHVSGGNALLDRGSAINFLGRSLTIGGAREAGGNSYARIDFQNYDNNGIGVDYIGAQILSFNAGGNDKGNLVFRTYDGTLTTRMMITPGGNVGIGTTSPTAQLHTTGSVRFASFGAGDLWTDPSGNVVISSDERLKNIRGEYPASLSELLEIVPILYEWKPETGYDTTHTFAGFSAQNVQKVIPEAIGRDGNGYLTFSERPVIAALVNAVKQLYAENQALKTRNDSMQVKLDGLSKLQSEITELRALVTQLAAAVSE